jgi:hypothetical protein
VSELTAIVHISSFVGASNGWNMSPKFATHRTVEQGNFTIFTDQGTTHSEHLVKHIGY